MNLGILFIVVLVVGGCFWYFKKKRDPNRIIENLEKKAYWLYGTSVEKSDNPIIYDIRDDDEKRLKKLEEKYIRLKEKFKYETKRRLEIAADWLDYNLEMFHKVNAWKKYGVNLEDSAGEKYAQDIKEPQLKIEEIEKRFDKLLLL